MTFFEKWRYKCKNVGVVYLNGVKCDSGSSLLNVSESDLKRRYGECVEPPLKRRRLMFDSAKFNNCIFNLS